MGGIVNSNYNYNDFNRFQNLDGIEWKLVNELLYSNSKISLNWFFEYMWLSPPQAATAPAQ